MYSFKVKFAPRAGAMILSSVFALTLLCYSNGSELHSVFRRSLDLTDLESVARDFVNRRSQEVGRRVSWWDMYGEHQHLRERPQYHRFKVEIGSSNVEYGQASRSAELPQTVQKKTYVNRTNNTISSSISWETRRLSSYTWKVDRGFKATWDGEIKTSIPFLGKPKNKTTVTIDSSREQTVHDEETFSISYSLQVPPKTETTAQWVITEREQEVPFNVDVFVKGYIAVWYSEKWNGHWLWFYPVSQIQDSRFSHFEGGLRFRASGLFRGVRGVDSHIDVSEKSLLTASDRHYLIQPSGAVPGD